MDMFILSAFLFMLAAFLGFELIAKVPSTLHTPLMSGANAISGITLLGAMIIASYEAEFFPKILGFMAVIFATMNIVGGYLVTHRMLAMFEQKGER